MTDLEITRLCAEAMGLKWRTVVGPLTATEFIVTGSNADNYQPLHDDSQAMALVKKFELHIGKVGAEWNCHKAFSNRGGFVQSLYLNRAICECVAKMQSAK